MLAYLFEVLHVSHILSVGVLNKGSEHLIDVLICVFLLLSLQEVLQSLRHVHAAIRYDLPRGLLEHTRALPALRPIRLLHH